MKVISKIQLVKGQLQEISLLHPHLANFMKMKNKSEKKEELSKLLYNPKTKSIFALLKSL